MRRRYIEITAGAPSLLGLYHDSNDACDALAKHHHPDNRQDIATAIKRSAAELAEVLPEATIASDLWRATVWQADHYDACHPLHEREDGYRRETLPIPQQTVIMGNATFGPMTITMPKR